MARQVAVVGDGSGVTDDPGSPAAPALAAHAALIEELTGLPTRVIALASGGWLENVLDGLPDEVGAVFLAHTEHDRAARAQATTTRVPVITSQDTTAIAVTAALLTALNQAGQSPQTGRVVIAGEQTLPILCPLLIAAGVGDITTWHPADAIAFPLRRIAADAHVVITGRAIADEALDGTGEGPTVIVADEACHSMIALAGLLRASVNQPTDVLAARGYRSPDLEIYLACVLSLILTTPPERRLPPRAGRALVEHVADQVADAVLRVWRSPATPLMSTHPQGDAP